jgi:hypothetical protein
MANIRQGAGVKNQPVAYPSHAGEVVNNRFSFAVPAAGYTIGDIIEIGSIPPNCSVVDMALVCDALTAGVGDVGVMSGKVGDTNPARTCGAEFFSAQSLAAAGSFRMTAATGFRVAPSAAERSIGIKLTTLPTAAGIVDLFVQFAT